MIMCVLLCYPVSIRIYYQQGGLFLVILLYLYPDSDPDHSQNFMGSKLDQDPASDFFENPTSSICVVLVTGKLTNRQS